MLFYSWFLVHVSWFRIHGSGFRVQGSGSWAETCVDVGRGFNPREKERERERERARERERGGEGGTCLLFRVSRQVIGRDDLPEPRRVQFQVV